MIVQNKFVKIVWILIYFFFVKTFEYLNKYSNVQIFLKIKSGYKFNFRLEID